MNQSKIKKSLYNTITMIISTIVSSVLSFISTNLILKNYGSDFNGVFATANQIVSLLLIVEGGFSLAINVSLFKPYVDNNIDKINSIMSASKKIFMKIGLVFFIIGAIVALVYSMIIKSNLDYLTIFLIFLMVISSTAFNLFFVIKAQILFQVSQREYIYNLIGILVNFFSGLTTILFAYYKLNILIIRLSILIYSMINGILILVIHRKCFQYIDYNVEPNFGQIKGTKDIVLQKLMSVIYLSSPLLYISTFISTKVASVYSVYSSIYNIVKTFLYALISAPINGFGQLISNSKLEIVYEKYKIYEYIIILVSLILITSLLVVILPFISIYTVSVTDINYIDKYMSVLLALILFLEVIHIPAGNIINVSGNFKAAKNIQIISCLTLAVLLSVLGVIYGIYGVLIAITITNLVLATLEITYTHLKIFKQKINLYLKFLFTNFIFSLLLFLIAQNINLPIYDYLTFFIVGFVVFLVITILFIVFNYVFLNKYFKLLIGIVKQLFRQFKSKKI